MLKVKVSYRVFIDTMEMDGILGVLSYSDKTYVVTTTKVPFSKDLYTVTFLVHEDDYDNVMHELNRFASEPVRVLTKKHTKQQIRKSVACV